VNIIVDAIGGLRVKGLLRAESERALKG